MKWLGEVIRHHLVCGTVFNLEMSLLLLISNKEVADVHVLAPFASTLAPISFQQHGTPVILVQDVLIKAIALSFQKQSSP